MSGIQTAGEGDKMRISHVIKTDQWRCAPQFRPAPHFVVPRFWVVLLANKQDTDENNLVGGDNNTASVRVFADDRLDAVESDVDDVIPVSTFSVSNTQSEHSGHQHVRLAPRFKLHVHVWLLCSPSSTGGGKGGGGSTEWCCPSDCLSVSNDQSRSAWKLSIWRKYTNLRF